MLQSIDIYNRSRTFVRIVTFERGSLDVVTVGRQKNKNIISYNIESFTSCIAFIIPYHNC